MTVTFNNGAIIRFDGLDENRITKVLGDAYNSIWINECNEEGFTYKHVSVLVGRLRHIAHLPNGAPLKNKMFFDCNPNSEADWEFKAFVLGINPIDRNALADHHKWVACYIGTEHNLGALGDDYLANMSAAMTASERLRYIKGQWAKANPGALFTETMFSETRIPMEPGLSPDQVLKKLGDEGHAQERITISVDPATTNDVKSDLSGITVQGLGETGHGYVLADLTRKDHPDNICKAVVQAYRDWGACAVIMEKNAGGLWLEATMRKHFPNVPLKFVSANATTGGKTSRAEPVAAQYERKAVHHVGALQELEDQMCDWGSPNSRKKSPDRMDAVVWGITELMDLNGIKSRSGAGAQMKAIGLYH
jgi:phage terminase large subunit-like protein